MNTYTPEYPTPYDPHALARYRARQRTAREARRHEFAASARRVLGSVALTVGVIAAGIAVSNATTPVVDSVADRVGAAALEWVQERVAVIVDPIRDALDQRVAQVEEITEQVPEG